MTSWKCHGIVLLVAVLLIACAAWKRTNNKCATSTLSVHHGDESCPDEPPVRIWIVTPESTGLRMDAAILERHVVGSQIALLSDAPPSKHGNNKCIYLYLEVSPMNLPASAHEGWKRHSATTNCRVAVVVNTDQFSDKILQTPDLELILCKTRQCVTWVQQARQDEKVAAPQQRVPIVYTGFTSENPSSLNNTTSDTNLDRFDKFLHVAGQSPHKGTLNILQAWMQHPEWPSLVLTSYNNVMVDTILAKLRQDGLQELPHNIQHVNHKLSKTELEAFMMSHGVHVCLSGMEGFGHYINEARAVGALVITTDYPAMNEVIGHHEGILVKPTEMLQWHNGLPYANVNADAVVKVMTSKVLPMSLKGRASLGTRARQAFYADQAEFAQRMRRLECYFLQCSGAMSAVTAGGDPKTCADKKCGLQLE